MYACLWIIAAVFVALPPISLWLINRSHEKNMADIYQKHQEAMLAIETDHREKMDAIYKRYKA